MRYVLKGLWWLVKLPIRLAFRLAFGSWAERKGRRAELRMKRKLEARGIPVIHDLFVRHGNGVWTQIDLAAFLGDRIAVIEVKNYGGAVEAEPDRAEWTVTYAGGRRTTMRSPLRQNAQHCKALRERFGRPGVAFENHVAFDRTPLVGGCEGVWDRVPELWPTDETPAARAAWDAIVAHHAATDRKTAAREHMRWVKGRR